MGNNIKKQYSILMLFIALLFLFPISRIEAACAPMYFWDSTAGDCVATADLYENGIDCDQWGNSIETNLALYRPSGSGARSSYSSCMAGHGGGGNKGPRGGGGITCTTPDCPTSCGLGQSQNINSCGVFQGWCPATAACPATPKPTIVPKPTATGIPATPLPKISISADFNKDGKVDLIDFEIWRNTVYN